LHQSENSRVRNVDRLEVPEPGRPPQMSRSPSHRDKMQMKVKHHMTAKPKSWSSEEYKDMKQYFMNWYMEVLKKQHEMEHAKVGKSTRDAPMMPEREERKSPKAEKLDVCIVNLIPLIF
jgi:hypothetical protein